MTDDDAPEMPAVAPTLPQDGAAKAEPSPVPADLTSPWPSFTRCRHIDPETGVHCSVVFGLSDAGLCWAHDPQRAEQADEARRRGGQATAEKRRQTGADFRRLLGDLETPADALRWASVTASEVAAGRIGEKRAVAVRGAIAGFLAAYAVANGADDVDGPSHEDALAQLDDESPRDRLAARLDRIARRIRESESVADLQEQRAELDQRLEAARAREAATVSEPVAESHAGVTSTSGQPKMGTAEPEQSPAGGRLQTPGKEPPAPTPVSPLSHWLIGRRDDEYADQRRAWSETHPGE